MGFADRSSVAGLTSPSVVAVVTGGAVVTSMPTDATYVSARVSRKENYATLGYYLA